MKLGIFASPWDVALEGVDAFLDRLAALGIRLFYLACCYHSASLIAPRRQQQVAIQAEANVAHLPLPEHTFTGISLPVGALARTQPQLFAELRAGTTRRGIEFFAWTVVFHNSDLARVHPQVAWGNCLGDRNGYGLCPAHPQARRYDGEMIAGLVQSGYFDGVMVESLSYLLADHGHPHELNAVRADKHLRLLQSLCFCPSCLRYGQQHGIDGQRLRARLAQQLTRRWNHPLSLHRSADDGDEIATQMLLEDDFRSRLQLRCQIVSSLAAEVGEIIHRQQLDCELTTAIGGRPAAFKWSEGVDIAASAAIADRLQLAYYYPSAGEVVRELDTALSYAPPERLGMRQTLGPIHQPTLEFLLAKTKMALAAGINHITLYNYSMATTLLLDWVAAVARHKQHHQESVQ